jgi:5-methylcytosine-specific restriction endonuclease McrA
MTTQSYAQRILHERIDFHALPDSLKKRVEAHVGLEWKTSRDGIGDLRSWLLAQQLYRCVYCQVSIPATSVGLCELDHILPKGKSHYCDPAKACLDNFDSRRHTSGYPEFTFAPGNLVVSCKQCNASKQSFDPLAKRSAKPTGFPGQEADYAWVHPHLTPYSHHISINENWLYAWHSNKGENTIKACKLNKSEVLARRHASETLASQSDDLNHFLFQIIGRVDEIGHRDILRTLIERFNLGEHTAIALIHSWNGASRKVSELEKLGKEITALLGERMLATKPKYVPPMITATPSNPDAPSNTSTPTA